MWAEVVLLAGVEGVSGLRGKEQGRPPTWRARVGAQRLSTWARQSDFGNVA